MAIIIGLAIVFYYRVNNINKTNDMIAEINTLRSISTNLCENNLCTNYEDMQPIIAKSGMLPNRWIKNGQLVDAYRESIPYVLFVKDYLGPQIDFSLILHNKEECVRIRQFNTSIKLNQNINVASILNMCETTTYPSNIGLEIPL